MEKELTLVDPYEHDLHCYVWETDVEVKGIIQIIHGAGEHMKRYEHFAKACNEAGFHVIGSDLLGHGLSATKDDRVFFSDSIGFHIVYEGIRTVRDYIEEQYPTLDVILFAHSMGSFFGRYAMIHNHHQYTQAIFSGTGVFSSFKTRVGIVLAKLIALVRGNEYVSDFFNHRILDGHIRHMRRNGLIHRKIDWLTQDRDMIKAFKDDPLTGKPFTIKAQQDVLSIIPEIQNKSLIKAGASSAALLFISGEYDALSDYGNGIKTLCRIYQDSGYSNVHYKVLNNCRHEIINEIERDKHIETILSFIQSNLK
ncbi:MAG: alpha/beta fold hydrolase [Candidatus Izemoplasma sp.]|nr:alpha/beta fold hydrolase [Candidatus Izemoplasma sp.]